MDKKIGDLAWFDLTTDSADTLRDFYSSVIGWKVNPVSMGDYQDYSMQLPGSGEDVAGVCHARGSNADLPPQWLLYFYVQDLDEALAQAEQRGGKLIGGMRSYGGSARFAVIQDPAGAVCALYEDNG